VTLSLAGGAIDIEDRARPIQSDTARRVTPGYAGQAGGPFAAKETPFENTEDLKMGA
jgi:hypothetical protein